MERAREISSLLLDKYDRGELKKIYIVYTDLKSSVETVARSTRLLPFHRAQFISPTQEKRVRNPFEFYPSVTGVLNNIIPRLPFGFYLQHFDRQLLQ